MSPVRYRPGVQHRFGLRERDLQQLGDLRRRFRHRVHQQRGLRKLVLRGTGWNVQPHVRCDLRSGYPRHGAGAAPRTPYGRRKPLLVGTSTLRTPVTTTRAQRSCVTPFRLRCSRMSEACRLQPKPKRLCLSLIAWRLIPTSFTGRRPRVASSKPPSTPEVRSRRRSSPARSRVRRTSPLSTIAISVTPKGRTFPLALIA